MTLITVLSATGMALGLGGIVPQIVRMARARSAAGQSPAGWLMCLAANAAMAYVNIVAFGAMILAASNLTAACLCGIAVLLILTLGRRPAPLALPPLEQLRTQELVILREAVVTAEQARGWSRAAADGGQTESLLNVSQAAGSPA
jgi:hypothetical protein